MTTRNDLRAWAIRNHVRPEALGELYDMVGLNGAHYMPEQATGSSEQAVTSVVMLEASRKGVKLFRNNVGVLVDTTGRPVRFGLANTSKEVNAVLKSGDLIGWRSVTITPDMVGRRFAQFVSRETKKRDWKYIGDDHEAAQFAWVMLVLEAGGDAAFCTGEGTL
jgi:hypothetical protein